MTYREQAEVAPDPPPKRDWRAVVGVVSFLALALGIPGYMLYVELTTPKKAPEPQPVPVCDCRCKCEVDCPDPPPRRPE